MPQLNKETFDQIIRDYKQLENRAREVFDIRCKHSPYRRMISTSIEFYEKEVGINVSWYCCGDQETDYVSFPKEYLWNSDEELHVLFAQDKKRDNERQQAELEQRLLAEKERRDAAERKQLAELINKYGVPGRGDRS